MRKSIVVLGATASLGAGIVAVANALPGRAGAPKSVRAQAPAPPPAPVTGHFENVAVPHWWLLEVGPHARSLVIEYLQGDGCSLPATPTVRESSTAIHITLRQRVFIPGPGESCTDEAKFSRLSVTLRSAVAGRHVAQPSPARSGQYAVRPSILYLSRRVPDPRYSDELLPLVPQIIGLSPSDATRVLRQQRFGVMVHGDGAEVTGQSPQRGQLAPGTTAAHPFAGVVWLSASSAGGQSHSGHLRSTPVRVTLAWFKAINDKNAKKPRSYFTPGARYMMDWGPASSWSTFTKLQCQSLSMTATDAVVKCTFHESQSPSEGNPDTFWSIELRHYRGRWLIDNYGQP